MKKSQRVRVCVYKDCGNYINLIERNVNDVKLFSFPKNPERRQKWFELGQVCPNVPDKKCFFCSDHFDVKYMAINNRRTLLVGQAVPFPYIEPEIVDSSGEPDSDTDYYLSDINRVSGEERQDVSDIQGMNVETTVTNETPDDFYEERLLNYLDEHEPDECVLLSEDEKDNQESLITYGNKRKLNGPTIIQTEDDVSRAKNAKTSPLHKPSRISETSNIKSVQISPVKTVCGLSPTNRTPCKEANDDEIDANQLVDSKNVTTFIYKGKEYVQIPKDYYINEKLEIMKKLRKMENTLRAIKGHLNDFDNL